ncbi:hypothetical protein [Colwellia psychrerythraea]|uniref:Uncharacterized protein n=1 Tax=Colwellia psychrerythraea TaxID=28229 RepID=A0A099KPB7_COLPS|nr:hypothetical protein [Colwellia psychrerythraea]KGJ92050.1 hypothetical protein GAB14E_2895 [Colwellia psychrerythraea]
MQIGEAVGIAMITDVEFDCPFDHELKKPPELKNELVGKGAKLATNMNNGTSTNSYKKFTPSVESNKKGKIPQQDTKHNFYRKRSDKGRCLDIDFSQFAKGGDEVKHFPVSCSAHHLIPSQESLKDHDILEYMCKEGAGTKNNHGFADGKVWSDIGYNTNGSENGVYLPGSYAVGGGKGGLKVWYSLDDEPDEEHDTEYIDADKLPEKEYKDYMLAGEKGKISTSNPCWHYVSKATDLMGGAQFHDRHLDYSDDIVKEALTALHARIELFDITEKANACAKCEEKRKKIDEAGLPTPYSLVKRLGLLSNKLSGYLTATGGNWKPNVYTSKWMQSYMKEVGKASNKDTEAAKLYIKR